MAILGVAYTHNLFAMERARVAIANELQAAGVSMVAVDNGWEYNLGTELQHAPYINISKIAVPAHAYVQPPPPPAGSCEMYWYDRFPHVHPIYGISFDPNACHGPAPFTPVHYSRWLTSTPGTLYVVDYLPQSTK